MLIRSHRSAARGFTLVELICCIVILGILAVMAGPRLLSHQPFEERGYVDEIAAALRQAQKVAVASGCDVQITVNGAGYQAMLRGLVAGGACTGAFVIPVQKLDGTPLAGEPPANVASAPAIQIIFDAQGRVTNGAPAPLVVGAFTLNVDAGRGFVWVQ